MKKSILIIAVGALFTSSIVQAANWQDLLKDELIKQVAPQQAEPKQSEPKQTNPADGGAQDNTVTTVLGAFSKTSTEDEIRIGRQIAGDLLGAAPLVPDPKLQRYVNEVGRWVALQSDRPDLPWHFGVIDTADINAFAAPGGYVFVTKGLYQKLNSEAELAGVLAHEISHVVHRDHLKILQKTQLLNLGAEYLGKQTKDQASVQKLIGSGAEIVARGLDKNAEFAADRMGVVLAARAGYDPYGLPAVLEEIGHSSPNDSRVALLFKTHPAPAERLSRLGNAIGTHFDGLAAGKELKDRFYRIR